MNPGSLLGVEEDCLPKPGDASRLSSPPRPAMHRSPPTRWPPTL